MGKEALPLKKLAEQFAALPSIGMKTAWRLAFYILTLTKEQAHEFADAIIEAREQIHRCDTCQNFTEKTVCDLCEDRARNRSMICVVENSKDVSAIEKVGKYQGLYHVLHGLISPIDGIGPEDITVKELLLRLQKEEVKEVIMATNPTIEGEATAMYLTKLIKPLDIKVTRLAFGLPVGGALEYADEMTLSKALQNRCEI